MISSAPAGSVATQGIEVTTVSSLVGHHAESKRQRRGTRGRKQHQTNEHQKNTTSVMDPMSNPVTLSWGMIDKMKNVACHESKSRPGLDVEGASHLAYRNIFIASLKSIVEFNLVTSPPPEKAEQQHKMFMLLNSMQGYVVDFALEKEGCRVVQHALEFANKQGQDLLMREFRGRVCEALRSPHANHVLQKAIELMSPSSVHFVFLELFQQFEPAALAKHQFGCRVLERLIEHFPPPLLSPSMCKLLGDMTGLCRHVYGNFVMQHILEHGEQVHKQRIIDALCENMSRLATHEHACGVVDKALTYGIPTDQRKLAQQILSADGLLVIMACQRGGLAATQRLLKVVDGELLDEAKSQLLAGIQQLKRGKGGKALLTTLIPEYQQSSSWSHNGENHQTM